MRPHRTSAAGPSATSHRRTKRPFRTGAERRTSSARLAYLGRVSRCSRVPAGTHPWVALAVTTPRPGGARVGDADTTPSCSNGPDRSQNEGIPHGSEQFIPRRAVRGGDRGGRGTHVHLRPAMGPVMLWPSATAVGWFLMMTALIVLARSGTARWEREQERGAGTGATSPCSEQTTRTAPSRSSSAR